VFVLDRWAGERGSAGYEALPAEEQAALRERLRTTIRTNTYDPTSGTLTLDPARAAAFEANVRHYADVQGRAPLLPVRPPHRHQDRLRLRTGPGPAAAPDLPQEDVLRYVRGWPQMTREKAEEQKRQYLQDGREYRKAGRG
jgi:nitric oxide reductase subunit B